MDKKWCVKSNSNVVILGILNHYLFKKNNIKNVHTFVH